MLMRDGNMQELLFPSDHRFLFLALLISDLSFCFHLSEPAKKQGRPHSQVHKAREQEQRAPNGLVGKGGDAEL